MQEDILAEFPEHDKATTVHSTITQDTQERRTAPMTSKRQLARSRAVNDTRQTSQFCFRRMLSRGLHPDTDTHPTVLVPRLYETLMSPLILDKEHTVLTKCRNPRNEQPQCPREKCTANYRLKHKPKIASQNAESYSL